MGRENHSLGPPNPANVFVAKRSRLRAILYDDAANIHLEHV